MSVAKPKALVVIAKATREAGEITPKVRDFIAENLELKTEVPALELADDGSLLGGSVDGKDILAETYSLGGQSPGVVVGPDSTPTLSFTSGSEGIPKGVRGRHFSLAYYFDFMARRFGLSSDDKLVSLYDSEFCTDQTAGSQCFLESRKFIPYILFWRFSEVLTHCNSHGRSLNC